MAWIPRDGFSYIRRTEIALSSEYPGRSMSVHTATQPTSFSSLFATTTTGFLVIIPQLQRGAARPVKRMKGTKEDGKVTSTFRISCPFLGIQRASSYVVIHKREKPERMGSEKKKRSSCSCCKIDKRTRKKTFQKRRGKKVVEKNKQIWSFYTILLLESSTHSYI
ncbi:hypothetical protein B0T09DRAFT_340685 [Sordaria sp. MPI-SDFR-AT-0083]|nr:hypothetical protein B0T09DRAFT_340685 [Sordaria sp. MPI-SDFR-AT-0083]